ncbi:MAG: hypothetical protein V5789_11355 [Colwellia sp.]
MSNYLNDKLTHNEFSAAQFTFALQRKYIAALIIAEKKADLGSANWLTLNKALAQHESSSALKLAFWFQEKYKKKLHHESNKVAISQAIMWFEQAIRLHSQAATVALAQLYYQQKDPLKALVILKELPKVLLDNKLAQSVLLLRIEMAIYLGDVVLVKQLLNTNTLKQYSPINIEGLLADIDRYGVVKSRIGKRTLVGHTAFKLTKNKESIQSQVTSTCLTSLQLFATNLKHLRHLEQLIKSFKEQQSLAQFICLPTPLYISKKRLECVDNSTQAIACDESRWLSVADEVNTRHIGLMLDKGGANVHFGILYFDSADDESVFSHEVSHLLGFVDEYPLLQNHASCQNIQKKTFSHNIAVLKQYYEGDKKQIRAEILMNIPWAKSIKTSTPILEPVREKPNKQKRWRLGTPKAYQQQVGIYLSESCQQSDSKHNLPYAGFSAFKPLSRPTQLRYYTNDFPKEYLAMLTAKPLAYIMPSFHYNIALALYLQGQVSDAKYWLEKASKWEDDPSRELAVLKGAF